MDQRKSENDNKTDSYCGNGVPFDSMKNEEVPSSGQKTPRFSTFYLLDI